MTPMGFGQFGPQGLDWQDLCRGTKHCYILIIEAVGLMVSEKIFFFVFFSILVYDS